MLRWLAWTTIFLLLAVVFSAAAFTLLPFLTLQPCRRQRQVMVPTVAAGLLVWLGAVCATLKHLAYMLTGSRKLMGSNVRLLEFVLDDSLLAALEAWCARWCCSCCWCWRWCRCKPASGALHGAPPAQPDPAVAGTPHGRAWLATKLAGAAQRRQRGDVESQPQLGLAKAAGPA